MNPTVPSILLFHKIQLSFKTLTPLRFHCQLRKKAQTNPVSLLSHLRFLHTSHLFPPFLLLLQTQLPLVLNRITGERNSLPPFLPAVSGKPLSHPPLSSPICKERQSFLTSARRCQNEHPGRSGTLKPPKPFGLQGCSKRGWERVSQHVLLQNQRVISLLQSVPALGLCQLAEGTASFSEERLTSTFLPTEVSHRGWGKSC